MPGLLPFSCSIDTPSKHKVPSRQVCLAGVVKCVRTFAISFFMPRHPIQNPNVLISCFPVCPRLANAAAMLDSLV
ncbi:uncharacterized protein SETTUDRAFT_162910, partial [Exserohilum turcica Et28A]